MARNQAPNFRAGGNINPSSFVKVDTSADNQCLQAGAGEHAIAISQAGTKDAPGITGATAYAAQSGDNIEVFGQGELCNLLAGTGGFVRGDFLKSDANGAGVTTTSSGDFVGAYALESAAAGTLGRVQVLALVL